MKLAKRLAVLVAAMMMVLSLTACGGGGEESGVTVYKMPGKFNSETDNMSRNLYLVDEDTFILEIDVLNSTDSTKHTVEYVCRGTYTLSEDGKQITLEEEFGSGYVMNGDTRMEWANGGMDTLMNVNSIRTFTLNDDGTYVPVE